MKRWKTAAYVEVICANLTIESRNSYLPSFRKFYHKKMLSEYIRVATFCPLYYGDFFVSAAFSLHVCFMTEHFL